jgi:hypothetical protein
MLLAAVLVLCVSCIDKEQDDAGRSTEAAKAAATTQEAEDPIAVSLDADLHDERRLAMLAIATFELEGYQEQLTKLAAEDPVACVTLAAVNGDPVAMVAYFETHATGRGDALLGAALGLSCAARVPSSAWEGIWSAMASTGKRVSKSNDPNDLLLDTGKGGIVYCAVSNLAFEELTKAIGREDFQGLGELILSGQVLEIPSGTAARHLEGGFTHRVVRVSEGEFAGEKVWVFSEWVEELALAGKDELDRLLWGLAQLDIEPGGPLTKSGLLEKQLADLHSEADAAGNLTRRAAIDALLGVNDNRTIDWQVYSDYAANATWNAVQWRALLRWADARTWRTMLGLPGLHENTRAVLAEALIAGGPDISLPGIPGQWLALGVDLEVRANEFMTGKVETISMPELARVLVPVGSPEGDGSSNAEPEMNLHKGNLGTVLVLFRYALIRGDSQAQQAVLDFVPKLPEEGRNAVLAMLMRTRPSVLTDEQLGELLALNDRSLGYYLLMGWHDRAPVQESSVASLVRVSPNRENVLVAEAYRQWLAGRQEPSAK